MDPTSVSEATQELRRLGEQARVYAGGTELLILMRHGFIHADHLVNIKRIPGLDEIVWDGRVLRIGAGVTHHRLERDPRVRQRLPMFAYAESQVANIRVRNQGTLGGNLCFGDPHSDPATALLVYEATVRVAGPGAGREMALSEFPLDRYTTALGADELLLEVQVLPLPPGWGGAYLRVHRLERPTLGVAAAARVSNGSLDGVRLAVGCVGPRPQRLTELEAKLRGLTMDEAQRVLSEAQSHLRELLCPMDDLLGSADYKLYLTRVLLSRALEQSVRLDGERADG